MLHPDRLDEGVYEDLVAGEEEYYKPRLEECARILIEQRRTSGRKARPLNGAHVALLATIVPTVPGLLPSCA